MNTGDQEKLKSVLHECETSLLMTTKTIRKPQPII